MEDIYVHVMHTEQSRLKVWQVLELEEKRAKEGIPFSMLLTERVGHLYKP